MRKKLVYFFLIFCFSSTVLTSTSCSKKTGCPVNENAGAKPDKNGNYGTKRGKSNLFPKKMR